MALFPMGPADAAQPASDKVRVQIVLRDTADQLRVYHASKGSVAGGMFIPFFGIGNAVKADARGDRLTQAAGSYARGEALAASLERVVPAKYPVFEVDAVEEGTVHASDADLARRARDGGFRYLLIVDEDFTGLSSGTVASDNDQVSVAINAKVELFNAADGNRMLKTRVIANSLARESLAPALESADFFRANYPAVADLLAGVLVGELLRTDKLHAMAKSIGRGDQVPAVSAVLARYDDSLRISVRPPVGWEAVKMNSPYVKVVQPKSELKFKLGVRLEMDLLLTEFGQDVATIEDYLVVASDRYAQAGLDPATLEPYQGEGRIAIPGYSAYSIKRQDGTGGQLMYFKLLEKPYLAARTVVATEDMDGLVAANRAAIEAVLLESDVAVAPSKSRK